MCFIPYDAPGRQLLDDWNEAIKKVGEWQRFERALLPSATEYLRKLAADNLAEARRTMAAAKVAHDRYRYQ